MLQKYVPFPPGNQAGIFIWDYVDHFCNHSKHSYLNKCQILTLELFFLLIHQKTLVKSNFQILAPEGLN